MEDGVTKDEIMAAGAPDLSPRATNLEGPKKENSQGVEEAATGTVEEREDAGGGFLSHIIPNLIHEKRTVEETEDEAAMRRIRETSMQDGPSHVTEDERGGEGVISHFITNLVSSPSPGPGGGQTDIAEGAELVEEPGRNRDGGEPSEAEVSSGNSGGGGGGGVIGSIISSILQHPNGSGGEEAGKEQSVVGGGGSEEGTAEEVSSGGGIVGNIIAHFSASLPGILPYRQYSPSLFLIHLSDLF